MAKTGATKAEKLVDQFFFRGKDLGARTAPGRQPLGDELFSSPSDDPPPESGDESRADLMETIQEHIIPRLVLAHFDDPDAAAACPDARLPPDSEEVAQFSRIAAAQDLPGALAFVESMVSQGVSIGTVLLHLVAPAARKLGDDWLEDLRTFAEVTLGLGTLQEVVHVVGPNFAAGLGDRGAVLLVAAPSEQHTLGLSVLGEFIRRAGWTVYVEPNLSRGDLIKRVQAERFDTVGITLSVDQLLEPLTELVSDVKKASLNPRVDVMVGGSILLADHAQAIGATFCTDAIDAVRHLDARTKGSSRGSRN